MSGVMQRILRGEMLCPSLRMWRESERWSYGRSLELSIRLTVNWWHYEELHGLPRTPWRNEAFNDVRF